MHNLSPTRRRVHLGCATLALFGVACQQPTVADAYPDCIPIDPGAVVCIKGGDERQAWVVEQGVLAWVDVYGVEFGAPQAWAVAGDVAIVWGDIKADPRCPCGPDGTCNVAGCMDPNGRYSVLWVSTRHVTRSWVADLTETALIHEMVHAAEWVLEQRLDYEHDDKPYRWAALRDAANDRWAERLDGR